jgi:outer membrane protein assembly factor BamE (lipoprotein component of BamABCDE complex)
MQVQGAGPARTRARVGVAADTARRLLLAILSGGALWAAVACTPIIRDHGYAPRDPDLATLQIGVDTRETVVEKVGRPSAEGLLSDTQWFYVQSRWQTVGPRAPVETDRQVVVISFSEGGTLQNIERFGLEDGKVVTLSRRVTESNIRGITLIEQLLGNIGRLRADQLVQ